MKRLLFVLLMLTGCASDSARSLEPSPVPGPGPTRVLPQTIGHSVLGRPIEMCAFGAVEGGRPVIVMGAIHGNEPTSADVSLGLLGELLNDARAATNGVDGVPVVVIPIANPDGLAA